ncbi:4F2 cell-surface antigen heavy chain-like [Thalassophryne amazonica]|uniref:4F2 cell-surface antigen heavy chain-like n=1 Tax=Thalassophryne amazonica TaxID=390379 RepID=UPI0014718311|nr:4F2 cell-surface antigen heavy chain-like [Thalassophryne amazonica]
MNKDTEIDMKDVELNELDPEKQPMTGDGQAASGEKNGSIKLKIPEDEVAFTGLSKEELMRVAGTPGWVRTRWVLLILFWLGWVGMLAGAVVIIVQAPRCKPIPEMNWWNEGPLYLISDLLTFSDGLKGVGSKLDAMSQLKVKGLVLGPLHTVQADQVNTLRLTDIDPTQGSKEELDALLQVAHKKGISVALDLTPNYEGSSHWFTSGDFTEVLDQLKAAAEYWFSAGVDGIKLSGLNTPSDWSKVQAVVQGNSTENSQKKLLMGTVEGFPVLEVPQVVNTSGVDLFLSDILVANNEGGALIKIMDALHTQHRNLGWGLGAVQKDHMSKHAGTQALIRLYQLLLFTMPGTPVFTYGDEIGLQAFDTKNPTMLWDVDKEPVEGTPVNETAEAQRKEYLAVKKWFKSLSELRGKERSLLYGDYYPLQSSPSTLSFLRQWDQSDRYITAVNWGSEAATLSLSPPGGLELPEQAKVKLSTYEALEVDSTVSLEKITLEPGNGVLLQFPYTT